MQGFFVHADGTPRLSAAEYLPTWYALRTEPAHAIEATQNRETLGLSTLFLVLLLAIWILAHFFRSAAWPEQLALFGLLGVVLFSPLLPVAVPAVQQLVSTENAPSLPSQK